MKIVCVHALRACAASVTLLLSAVAVAAESGASQMLTFDRAIALATAYGPVVSAMESEQEALAQRAQAEALPPGFVLESEIENFAGSGNVSGVDVLETTVRLSRVIELGDKPSRRRDVGAAELDKLGSTQQARRLSLAAEVARRFVRVVADQETVATAVRSVDLARTARDVVRQRVNEGASSPAALSRAEIALSRAQIEQKHAEHTLASSRTKLSALWGAEQADFATAAGDLFALPELDPLDGYRVRLSASPDLQAFDSETKVQDARARLADARALPDISVSAGVRRLEGFGDQALVASFSVPLGTRARADFERRAIRADRNRVDAERESRRLELHAELFELYQEAQHARTEAEALRTQIRPQAAAMLTTTVEGYRAGRFSLIELADAQTQMIEVERDAIRAASQFHTLSIEIQRVTGQPIAALGARSQP
jgi:cobalt-zinc-cadmium efflux system outer membrane protein